MASRQPRTRPGRSCPGWGIALLVAAAVNVFEGLVDEVGDGRESAIGYRAKTARRQDGKTARRLGRELSRSARDAGPVPVGVAPIQLRRASALYPANS
jgi:hypothetical protein